jgi:AGCS family alanine or glycine:cation symporter
MSEGSSMVAASVDDTVQKYFGPISEDIVAVVFYAVEINGASVPLIVLWLIVAAIFFTIWLGLPQFSLGHSINLVRGRYSKDEHSGEVSHFQALATAVSGTVGWQHRRRGGRHLRWVVRARRSG